MQYSMLLLFGVNGLLTYVFETQRKQKLLDIFGSYVPQELVAELNPHTEPFNFDGESKHMTIQFCDLQNLSGISKQMTPRELVKRLDDYFNALTAILSKYGTIVDK